MIEQIGKVIVEASYIIKYVCVKDMTYQILTGTQEGPED